MGQSSLGGHAFPHYPFLLEVLEALVILLFLESLEVRVDPGNQAGLETPDLLFLLHFQTLLALLSDPLVHWDPWDHPNPEDPIPLSLQEVLRILGPL